MELAAIVCGDVAAGTSRILYCERSEPEEPADSGWQFTCGLDHQNDGDEAQVWSVGEVLEQEPSLLEFIGEPIGTIVFRSNDGQFWQVKSV